MEHWWNDTDRAKLSTLRKTCPSASLSTTHPTLTGLGSNLGLTDDRPITDCTTGIGAKLNINYLE
jgi:hypothetical protein